MTEAHPEMAALFERWKWAELASHYADACPDEVMDALVDRAFTAMEAAASKPATCADDVLLKVFMLAVVELEPKAGDPPLTPLDPDGLQMGGSNRLLWKAVLADIAALSPATVAACREPHRNEFRRKDAA